VAPRVLPAAEPELGERQGLGIAAAGTHPFSHWRDQQVTDKPRYHNLAEDDRQVFREQIVFGCHVHVGIEGREATVQTMNRVRPWPTAGMPQSFASPGRGGLPAGPAPGGGGRSGTGRDRPLR
jgi:glutamate---cysteine ligase / carboxylate-amine ligase